jgi:hypothetical protein
MLELVPGQAARPLPVAGAGRTVSAEEDAMKARASLMVVVVVLYGLSGGCAAIPPRPAAVSQSAELRLCNDWQSTIRVRLNNGDAYPVLVGGCTSVPVAPGPNALFPEPHILPGDWFASDAWIVDVPSTGAEVRFGRLGGPLLEVVRVQAPKGAALSWQRCDWPNRLQAGQRVPYGNTYYPPDLSREQALRWVRSALVCEVRPAAVSRAPGT